MEIIEKFRISKTGKLEDCEDFINFNEHFVIVVDGTTSKSDLKWDGKESGLVAAKLISNSINDFAFDITKEDAVEKMTLIIERFYRQNRILITMKSNPQNRISCSVIIFSKYQQQIWMIGDCQCLIDGKLHNNEKKIDKILSEFRRIYIEMELMDGKTIKDLQTNDTGREAIFPFLKKQGILSDKRKKRLMEYKYAVIDGFSINPKKTKIIKIKRNTREIIFASDGYPELKSTLEQSERILKKILKRDPLLFKEYKSTKGLVPGNASFDDRCYIRFKLR